MQGGAIELTWAWNTVTLLLLIGLSALLYLVIRRIDSKYARVGLITFAGLPLAVCLLADVASMLGNAVIVARGAFIYAVVLLPPSLFFLFIASRRESLFNQYTTNLDRLGLLRKRQLRVAGTEATHYPVEDDARLARRVKGYLDRFSAVYGSLPPELVNQFLASVIGKTTPAILDAGSTNSDLFATFELKTVLPVFGAGALIALGWLMVLPPYPVVQPSAYLAMIEDPYKENWFIWAAEPVLLPVTFAFLGAYFFSLQMLIKRFMRRDLGPYVYNAVSMRIILATLGVWVATQCYTGAGGQITNTNNALLFILSFAVGAFPLIIWQLVSNMLKKLPFALIALPNLEGTLPLSQIDGLSVWHEARLDEEDIENVPNLATADIVDLMLNTKISATRIVDWVDQALLLLLLPAGETDGRSLQDRLKDYGIRTASALVAATRPGNGAAVIDSLEPADRKQAVAIAASVQLCPNYPIVMNWLATEPYVPSDIQPDQGSPGPGEPPVLLQAAE